MILDSTDTHPCQDANCSDDLCVICYDKLDQEDKPSFTIPECGHKFHQLCINSWFRQGNEKCPLCNDMGLVGNTNSTSRRRGNFYWGIHDDRFSVLSRISKKKNAPKILIKEMEKYKTKNQKIINAKKEQKQWRETKVKINGEEITIQEIIKKSINNRRKLRSMEWGLRKFKRRVIEKTNIVPLVLVEKKIIN
tara:strand:+ start:195 stop:773 length:579 start_codon:yes stop_codon:yes gene_type:complete